MNKHFLVFLIFTCLISCKTDPSASSSKVNQIKGGSENENKDLKKISKKVLKDSNQYDSNIDAKTALMMLSENDKIKIVDVRTQDEIKEGSFPGSLKIDFLENSFKTKISKLDKKDTYIVYCRSGGRSAKAVSMMKDLGFENAYNMKDGFSALDKASN